jgi:hypothetical protein
MLNKMKVGEDMICPVTKSHCDDECCPPGAECNLGSDSIQSGSSKILESIEITRSFYETFGHITGVLGQVPELKTRELRIDLIQEELHELSCATGTEKRFLLNSFNKLFFDKKNNSYKPHVKQYSSVLDLLRSEIENLETSGEYDIKETVDATSDLQVVLDGSNMAYGTHVIAKEALIETNDSNMSKGCLTEDEALYNAAEYAKEGIEIVYIFFNNMYVLYNKENKKILKNKLRFRKPNYQNIIDGYSAK